MRQKVRVAKSHKSLGRRVQNLLRQPTELQKLREQVRQYAELLRLREEVKLLESSRNRMRRDKLAAATCRAGSAS